MEKQIDNTKSINQEIQQNEHNLRDQQVQLPPPKNKLLDNIHDSFISGAYSFMHYFNH